MTKNLIILNVILFILTLFLKTQGIDLGSVLGAYLPQSPNFASYQILTHLFMHGSFTHLLFNMIALWSFGSSIEYTLGNQKFFLLYLICGLGAFVLYNLWSFYELSQLSDVLASQGVDVNALYAFAKVDSHSNFVMNPSDLEQSLPPKANADLVIKFIRQLSAPMVGASGAIYGLLASFALLYPNQKIMMIFPPIPIKAKIMMPLLMLVEFYLGIQNAAGDNVAHFAHLGGALVALILLRVWKLWR